MRYLVPILAAMLPLAGLAPAAPRGELVEANLVANVSSVKLGEPFMVGVLLKLAPHYHVYWTNPGDSGQATSIQVKAFPNSSVEILPMPTPFRFELPGGLINYGYENEVLFLAKVTPHVNPKANTDKLELEATVSWLVCSEDECIPGDAKLSLSLPIAAIAKPDNAESFQRWEAQIPSISFASAAIHAPPTTLEISFDLPGAPEKSFKDVQWFPGDNEPLIVKDIQLTRSERGANVSARLELPAGATLSRNSIESVLGYTDERGMRRGTRLVARFQSPLPEESSTVDKGK